MDCSHCFNLWKNFCQFGVLISVSLLIFLGESSLIILLVRSLMIGLGEALEWQGRLGIRREHERLDDI